MVEQKRIQITESQQSTTPLASNLGGGLKSSNLESTTDTIIPPPGLSTAAVFTKVDTKTFYETGGNISTNLPSTTTGWSGSTEFERPLVGESRSMIGETRVPIKSTVESATITETRKGTEVTSTGPISVAPSSTTGLPTSAFMPSSEYESRRDFSSTGLATGITPTSFESRSYDKPLMSETRSFESRSYEKPLMSETRSYDKPLMTETRSDFNAPLTSGLTTSSNLLQTGVPIKSTVESTTITETKKGDEVISSTGPMTTTTAASGASTGAILTTPVSSTTTKPSFLVYTGMKFDVPGYLFSWNDDLHVEIPQITKKQLKNADTSTTIVINEPVYAHKGRHMPARKKRQRWIFKADGYIISEYNHELALSCYNGTVVVQRRGFDRCQQWVLKPSTDSNYFYICCAKNPNMAVDVDKSGELIHQGYPLVLRPLGNLSTAWGFDV